jgi:hypothetical protein
MRKFTFKQYENKPTTRSNFKIRCISYGKNYKDFDEVFTGEINKSGNKLFNYFLKGPNKGKQEQVINNFKTIDYYETHSITSSNFINKCKEFGKDYREFKRIYSGEKTNKNKKYYYKYVGKENIKNVTDRNIKEYYESHPTKRFIFKRICKRKNWNFDFFEEIDSGQVSGGNKKYYYKYTGKRVYNAERYKYLIDHYETCSITPYRFKQICRKRGYKFQDFEQIESGEKLGNNKKYFYKLKKNGEGKYI